MAGITAAVIGAGTAIYSASRQKKAQDKALDAAKDAQKAADPYAAYRPQAAQQLSQFSQNAYTPNMTGVDSALAKLQSATDKAGSGATVTAGGSVGNLTDYNQPYLTAILDARMQAAQRQSAAQGYTGSGNALVAAANAGTEAQMYAYQLAEQDRQAAERTRQLQFDASTANASLGLQRDTLGMQGASAYLNAMYQREGFLQDAYNDRFNQLALLSGAGQGLQNAANVSGNVSSGYQNVGQAQANMGSTIGTSITGLLGNLDTLVWGKTGGLI